MRDFFYPRRMCYNYDGKSLCRFMRTRPAFLIDDRICIHPYAGPSGMLITSSMNTAFSKTGCACWAECECDGKGKHS
jgi:hypothetical protein